MASLERETLELVVRDAHRPPPHAEQVARLRRQEGGVAHVNDLAFREPHGQDSRVGVPLRLRRRSREDLRAFAEAGRVGRPLLDAQDERLRVRPVRVAPVLLRRLGRAREAAE